MTNLFMVLLGRGPLSKLSQRFKWTHESAVKLVCSAVRGEVSIMQSLNSETTIKVNSSLVENLISSSVDVPGDEINRDAILNLIDEFFSSGIPLVSIEGRSDIGKSRLLRQFCAKHSARSVSLFLQPHSWFLKDPALFYAEIASQIEARLNLHGRGSDVADETVVRRLLFEVQKVMRARRERFYIVVDGMEDVIDQAGPLISTLIGILPFEFDCFRFLFSGSLNWLPKQTLETIKFKPYTLAGFSLGETEHYLREYGFVTPEVDELYRSLGNGTPGYLASAKRLLQGGMSKDQLFERLHTVLPHPFEIEWQALGEVSNELRDALAILAFDSTPHPIQELAAIVESEVALLTTHLQRCTFIRLSDQSSGGVHFVSASFRNYAADQLRDQRLHTWSRLASYFLKIKETDRASGLLPTYLDRADKPAELLALLDASTFIKLTETSDSFIPLIDRSRLGLDTALQLKRHAEALRFGIQSGLVAETSPLRTAKAEVLARLSVGDNVSAITLAQTSVLKKHRLQLLAVIARYYKEHGLSAETEILDTISNLCGQVTAAELGGDLFDTASDIMYTKPDLALRLISQSVDGRPDDRSVDWTLIRLSAFASSIPGNADDVSNPAADIRSKIRDPRARNLSAAISMLVDGTSAREILKQAATFSTVDDQISFLRQWCRNTEEPESAHLVIDHAVYLSIRSTEYTATARDYRDLATPLPKMQDSASISSLISAFDIQKEAARKTGPTQDFVQFQLLVAEAENLVSPVRSGQRLAEVYYFVQQVTDIEVRATCLALILAAAPRIDPSGAFQDSQDIKDLCEGQFQEELEKLLSSTADHYAVTESIIEALAVWRTDLALQVIDKLNYQSRRDRARADLAMHLLEVPSTDLKYSYLQGMLGAFSDPELNDSVVEETINRFSRISSPTADLASRSQVLRYLDSAPSIGDPVAACKALSGAIVFLAKSGSGSGLTEKLKAALKKRWQSIDDAGVRLRIGYRAVSRLADYNRAFAEEFLAEIEGDALYKDDSSNGAIIQCVRLAIRAYAGLLPQHLETEADFERLSETVDGISSRSIRVRLWSDLALRCMRNKCADEAKKIVQSRLRPLLDALRVTNEYDWREAMTYAVCALYAVNPMDTLDSIDSLPQPWQRNAFESLSRYKKTGVPAGEPFQRGESPYHLDYDSCLELLKISERMNVDYDIYLNLSDIADSSLWKHNRTAIAQSQRVTLAERMRAIVDKKLPCPSGIAHEGYKLLGEAQALRLIRERDVDWAPLIARARMIPNLSDRVFVLAILAECMPLGKSSKSAELVAEARQLCAHITSVRDRIGRYRVIASIALGFDKGLAKGLIQDAVSALGATTDAATEDDEIRDLVDLAYQVDPDLAARLASELDSDYVRKQAKAQVAYQNLRSKLRDNLDEVEEDANAKEVAKVAWDLLGQLNAGRIVPRDTSACMSLVKRVREIPFLDAFPLLSFVIENLLVRRSQAGEAKTILREIFDATINACDVTRALMMRAAGRSVLLAPQRNGNRMLIAAGQRQKALKAITDWIRSSAGDHVYICDPFFGPRDLDIVQLLQDNKPYVRVVVLTSLKQQSQDGISYPFEEFYADYWRKNFREQSPPELEVVVVGTPSGELPIHDRWLVSSGSGLRIGTSLNSLGVNKDSELTPLTQEEAEVRMNETLNFVQHRKREHLGQKLSYAFFDLGQKVNE